MPIRKFRSVEEMEGNVRQYEPGSPELFRAIRELCGRSRPASFPAGSLPVSTSIARSRTPSANARSGGRRTSGLCGSRGVKPEEVEEKLKGWWGPTEAGPQLGGGEDLLDGLRNLDVHEEP